MRDDEKEACESCLTDLIEAAACTDFLVGPTS